MRPWAASAARFTALFAGVAGVIGAAIIVPTSAAAALAVRTGTPHGMAAASAGPAVSGSMATAPPGLRAAVRQTFGQTSGGMMTAPNTGLAWLGFSVAVSGPTAVVGAPLTNSSSGAIYAGAAFVYTRSGSRWIKRAKLADPAGTANDEFGVNVAVSGTTVAVSDITLSNTGKVYLFQPSGNGWALKFELDSSMKYFGDSMALSGTTLVVGSYQRADVYTWSGSVTTISHQAKLTAPSPASHNFYFGFSVAISGSTAVVGDPAANALAGAAWVFTRSRGAWHRGTRLTSPGSFKLGFSLAVSDSTVIAGTWRTKRCGQAYVFSSDRGRWRGVQLRDPICVAGDAFGYAVAVSGAIAVIGAPRQSLHRCGAAFVYQRSNGRWSERAQLAHRQCALHDFFGYSVATSDRTAVIGAPGKNNLAGAVYVITLP